ncbi:MAG: glycosyltransferase [Acidobacteriota bacterium]|nr:glycosyltransferase [Acidobacteriota bacterium]
MALEQSLAASAENWKRAIKAYVKGALRRQMDARLPSREVREYRRWIKERQISRTSIYTHLPYPGLFSILTPVWNGSPLKYLRKLAESISGQNANGACEWVVLDNGCSNSRLLTFLEQLNELPWVNLQRTSSNVGIIRGLRLCLERAQGRYVLPVDGDDLLYPDALLVVASGVIEANYPALLYTDEDKVIDSRQYQPYFKPDWDPVLLLNSAYIAHLGVIDRERALELGAYSDQETEGSPDWDLFVRFLIAGDAAVHIPEIVYSWRVHASSTADDASVKPYISSSHRKVLQRFLDARREGRLFEIERSPLFAGGAHWHFRRRHEAPRVFGTITVSSVEASGSRIEKGSLRDVFRVSYDADPRQLLEIARELSAQNGFVCFMAEDAAVEYPDWEWEAIGITDLHPETVMIGGRIRNGKGIITEAGLESGAAGVCSSPNEGRSGDDPGYFGQVWKQRTVDAVSTHFAITRASFLAELLEHLPGGTSVAYLGAWGALYARKTGRRVVYSPFLSATSDTHWDKLASNSEKGLFQRLADGRSEFGDHPQTANH